MLLNEVSHSTVLVRCSAESSTGSSSEEYLSGLLFEPRLVLCSGLLLRNEKTGTSRGISSTGRCFSVLGHPGSFKKYLSKQISEWESRVATSATSAGKGFRAARPRIAHVSASIVRIFTDKQLEEMLSNVLSDWTLGDARQTNGEDNDMKRTLELASVFLVLELHPENRPNNIGSPVDIDKALRTLLKACLSTDIPPASRLAGGGIPFGSSAFLGSLSTGILSAVVGEPPRLALTDLRTAPGSEGGPVFADANAHDSGPGNWRPFALVLLPVSWCRGEWVGFTLLVTLRPLLENALSGSGRPLLQTISGGSSYSALTKCFCASKIGSRQHPLENSILMVRCGTLWGSGVVVSGSKRVVVTCAHVLQQHPRHPVRVVWGDNIAEAQVNFRSSSDRPFDVAVLTVGGSGPLRSLKISKIEPRTGDPVLAAGYPLIPEIPQIGLKKRIYTRHRSCPEPVLSAGTLSIAPGKPSLFLTSCCVQSGSSGGALVCRRRGQLVGITVSNAQAAGAVHPFLNMAIPATVLASPITSFLQTGDESVLKTLCPNDPEVSREWMLQTLPPSRL